MDDIFVYVVCLPEQIREIVLPCADGYTVYINEKLSRKERLKAYHHAVGHIKSNDWNKVDVQVIESDAHKNGGLQWDC